MTWTSRNVSYFLILPLLTRSTEIGWQVTSCGEIFEIGSFPLIHGKTTILPVNRTTRGLQRGFFKATRIRNGKHPDRVHFYGYMGNVSSHIAITLSQILIVFTLW